MFFSDMGKDSTNKIGRLRALKEVSNCRSLNPFDEFKELQEDSSSGLWQVWLFAVEGSLFAILQVLLYGRIAREDTKVSILLWIGSILATISVWLIISDTVVTVVSALIGVTFILVIIAAFTELRHRSNERSDSSHT